MVLSPFRIVHQLLEERSFYSTLLDKFDDRCSFPSKEGWAEYSLHNGNAEANFGDKLSASLSSMNNLSFTNSQIRFLVNFETSNATFGVQNSKICEENINVEFVYFKGFLRKQMLGIQISENLFWRLCRFGQIREALPNQNRSFFVNIVQKGGKIQHREPLFPC